MRFDLNSEYVVPPSWAEATVGDICKIVGGGTPPTTTEAHWNGTIPWITSADIYGVRDIRPRRQINEGAVKASATNLVPGGSIIVVTRVGLGKVALVEEPLCFSQDSQGLIFDTSNVDGLYLTYFLSDAVQRFKYESRGTTINGVTKKQLRDLPVLLPPLAEQRRIVAEIERHFTRLDASVAALRRAQANLKHYRASVLKDACEGRLVPTEAELALLSSPKDEGREYEPAAVLLERILAERRVRWESQEKRRGKYKEPSAPDASTLPQLPEGWAWAKLDQVLVSLEGGTAVAATDVPSSRPVLRSSAVRQGSVDYDDYRYLPCDAKQTPDPFITRGDLLFTRLSGTLDYVGNCSVVRELNDLKMEFPDRLFRGRCMQGTIPGFIQLCFEDKTLRRNLEEKAKSTAGHQRISLSDLREYLFPLPPLAEQRRIVAEVERRLSVIQQAEATVEASLVRAERLRQSILKQAFSGRLVPQDPDDEPASALLERIRAEREAEAQAPAAAKGKQRRGKGRATR